jgi:hypothetical protein
MSNKLPPSSSLTTINPGDEKIQISMNVADAKVVIQVIDRLFSMGGVRGDESLPIAIVRTKLIDITKGDNNVG